MSYQPVPSACIKGLEELLCIDHIVRASINFHADRCVTASVTFYLSGVQANAVITLCTDGKWRSKPDGQ